MRHDMKIASVLVAATMLSANALAQTAGKVLVSVGDNRVERQGKALALKAGDSVQPGDTLQVGATSNVQVRFSDQSVVALRPNTTFRVEEYAFAANPDEDRSVFSLIKGGLRTLTGFIGRTTAKNYQVRTPTATIGIRGTHYSLLICDGSCLNPDGSVAEGGLYGSIVDGRIAVGNSAGEEVFGRNSFFHVVDANSIPRGLIAPPPFLGDRLEGRQAANRAGTSGDGLRSASNNLGDSISQRGQALSIERRMNRPSVFTIGDSDEALDAETLIGSASKTFAVSRQKAGGIQDLDDALFTGNVTPVGTSLDLVDVFKSAYIPDPGSTRPAKIESTRVLNGQSVAPDTYFRIGENGVAWGSFTTTREGSAQDVVHWLVGNQPASLPHAGRLDYHWVGGTAPTSISPSGQVTVGSNLTASTLTVDFSRTAATLALSPVRWNMGGTEYVVSIPERPLVRNPSLFSGQSSINLGYQTVDAQLQVGTGGATPAACASGCSAKVVPTFFGANATGAGLGIATTTPAEQTSSIQVFQR